MNPLEKPIRHRSWMLWQNPIFRRYCKARLRPRSLAVALLLTLLIPGFITALTSSIGVRTGMSPADAARNAIIPLMVFQSLILFILGTAQVSGGMVAERDEGVIDYQRMVPMTPLAKVLGYLFGLPVREYVLVLFTLPFTAWALWRGEVAMHVWLPLYVVIFSAALLYHFTGLITGTVAKSKRWAFLASIGLVFALYTVVPQMAKFGLVFFRYLTITPVFQESLPGLLPRKVGSLVSVGQQLMPTVKFFGLSFSELTFSLFSQGGLILTFIVMLCRRWRSNEAHLLGKLWATGFFIWVQVLLLGNALPLIEPGSLFPSREFGRMVKFLPNWAPQPMEAVAMSGVYGLFTMGLIMLLGAMVTPSVDQQLRGWRRARKHGETSLRLRSDASTGFGAVLIMALTGAAGWVIFTRALVESRWFPGHVVPGAVFGYFAAVLFVGGVGFQVLLEQKGGRFVALAGIMVGVVPLMVGTVLGMLKDDLAGAASWISGISPASLPFYASGSLLSIAELPSSIAKAMPRAFHVWLAVGVVATLWRIVCLWRARRAMAKRVLDGK